MTETLRHLERPAAGDAGGSPRAPARPRGRRARPLPAARRARPGAAAARDHPARRRCRCRRAAPTGTGSAASPRPIPATFFPTFEAAAAFLDGLPVPIERVVLGGFSQGAVMSWALGLGAGRPRPAAIIALSGFMPEVEGFELDLTGLDGYPIAVAHGSLDPVIPVEFSRAAAERVRGSRCRRCSGARPRCRTRSTRACCRSCRRSSRPRSPERRRQASACRPARRAMQACLKSRVRATAATHCAPEGRSPRSEGSDA